MEMMYYSQPSTAERFEICDTSIGSALNFYDKAPISLFYGI